MRPICLWVNGLGDTLYLSGALCFMNQYFKCHRLNQCKFLNHSYFAIFLNIFKLNFSKFELILLLKLCWQYYIIFVLFVWYFCRLCMFLNGFYFCRFRTWVQFSEYLVFHQNCLTAIVVCKLKPWSTERGIRPPNITPHRVQGRSLHLTNDKPI